VQVPTTVREEGNDREERDNFKAGQPTARADGICQDIDDFKMPKLYMTATRPHAQNRSLVKNHLQRQHKAIVRRSSAVAYD
jgi:hypothetical protein